MKKTAYIITFLFAATLSFAATALDDGWRQQAQEMLDDGRTEAALYVLQDIANRVNEIETPQEQADTLRYLAALYAQAEKPAIAKGYFTEAMRRSLELTPPWRQFHAVIAVLKLQKESTNDRRALSALLQNTLDMKLLTAVARETQAKELARYIQCFQRAGTQSQALMLLHELREIAVPWLRQQTLESMAKVNWAADAVFDRQPMPTAHYDADNYERFLWQYVLLKLHRGNAKSAQYREFHQSAKSLAETLPTAQKTKAHQMLRAVR